MTETCPNCGKPVLPTDTVCWHCGYALPKRAKDAGPPMPPRVGPARQQPGGDAADYDLRALLIYGLLTLALLLSLWLVMRALGRQPALVRGVALAGGDWVAVTDTDLRYTLSLPADWQWLDVAYREQGQLLAQVIERQPYVGQALAPQGETAGDVEVLAVALATQDVSAAEQVPFVLVGRNQQLVALEPRAALDLLSAWGVALDEPSIDTHLSGQPQGRFLLYDSSSGYSCRHLFTAGFLVAACVPQSGFGMQRQVLDDILDTFQLLVN